MTHKNLLQSNNTKETVQDPPPKKSLLKLVWDSMNADKNYFTIKINKSIFAFSIIVWVVVLQPWKERQKCIMGTSLAWFENLHVLEPFSYFKPFSEGNAKASRAWRNGHTHIYLPHCRRDLDRHILIIIVRNIVITKILIRATGYLKSQLNIEFGSTSSMLPTFCLFTYL